MGMVAMTYKINPDSDVDDVDADAIATTITGMGDEVYNIQSVEVKPLAFGLKFVQVTSGPLVLTCWTDVENALVSTAWAAANRCAAPWAWECGGSGFLQWDAGCGTVLCSLTHNDPQEHFAHALPFFMVACSILSDKTSSGFVA